MKHLCGSTCISALLALMISTSLAQTWKWTRDDLALNPSGLDLSNAAGWAWGDLDRDGELNLITQVLQEADWRLLNLERRRDRNLAAGHFHFSNAEL